MESRKLISAFLIIACATTSAVCQVTLGKKNIKCNGDKNGKVSVLSIKNATYPINSYDWSNGESGPDKKSISNLPAGTYSVTVTDANLCTASAQATVEGPSTELGLALSSSSDEFFVCGTASIRVIALPTGGTPPYNTNGSDGAYTTTVSLSSFGGGPKYLDFQTTDANGCTKKHRQFFAFSAISCASDPNDITGPFGIEEDRWIAAKDIMDYTIRFENDPDLATAPAQVVKVTLPVDPKMNPFSLRLGDFGWGPFTFNIPEGSTFYQTRLDLIDSLNLYIDVTAGYNINNNEYFWMLESIDPVTGQLPIDPQRGFLPVNDTLTGSGEGFLHFSVKPKSNAITGDSIHAQAEIIFDVNESIFTNTWKNKLDAVAPVSELESIIDSSENNIIDLHWTAEDDSAGVGVRDYELFVSVDNAVFTLIEDEIADTFYTYSAVPGSTYSFVVLATDRVGNREEMKVGEDTIYVIPVRSIDLVTPAGHNLCVYDSLTISWTKTTVDSVRLEMSLDSGETYFVLAPLLTADSFTVFLHDSMISEEVFLKLTDLDVDSITVESQELVIHELPIVDAGAAMNVCIGDYTFLAATGANQFVWDSNATLNLLDVYNPRSTPLSTQEYFVQGTDVFGCRNYDSVVVTVLPVYLDSVVHTMCNEDSVFVGGDYQTTAGFYTDYLAASTGCDSTVVTEVVLTGPCPFPVSQVYVDKDATGLNNGTSWANAFTDLQDALAEVEYRLNVTEIWIAEGDYYPSPAGDRDTSFVLRDSVTIYGGFTGVETSREERVTDPGLVRISGDIGVLNDTTDNVYHVVTIDNSCVTCVLDRLTIQFGQGDGLPLNASIGAGLFVKGKVLLEELIIERNTATMEGAAIYNSGATAILTIRDCLFRLNNSGLERDILNSNGAEIKFEGINMVQD